MREMPILEIRLDTRGGEEWDAKRTLNNWDPAQVDYDLSREVSPLSVIAASKKLQRVLTRGFGVPDPAPRLEDTCR